MLCSEQCRSPGSVWQINCNAIFSVRSLLHLIFTPLTQAYSGDALRSILPSDVSVLEVLESCDWELAHRKVRVSLDVEV